MIPVTVGPNVVKTVTQEEVSQEVGFVCIMHIEKRVLYLSCI